MKTSKTLRILCHATFALVSALAAGVVAHGKGIPGYPDDVRYGYDPREVAMLPRYCIYTQLFRSNVPGGNNKNEIDRWYLIMGDTFHAMHHYCWALMKTNRATLLAKTQQLRTYYLSDSIAEFDYVIDRAPKTFILLPEIHTKKGENLIRLGRGPLGILELQRAIELKPDYWPPYAAMSDHYKAIGKVQNARDVLEKGLSFSPDAKGLKMRLSKLDEVKRTPVPQSGTPPQQSKP